MTPEQQQKHDAEYHCNDPMVYRPVWAQHHTEKDIPAQIASWRREAAAMPIRQDGRLDTVRRVMHALADQMEYLWLQTVEPELIDLATWREIHSIDETWHPSSPAHDGTDLKIRD